MDSDGFQKIMMDSEGFGGWGAPRPHGTQGYHAAPGAPRPHGTRGYREAGNLLVILKDSEGF